MTKVEEMKLSLKERRAWFVYEAARVENRASGRPINPEPWEKRDAAFRKNMTAAVAKQCGPQRSKSPSDRHDAWTKAYKRMSWVYGPVRSQEFKTHRDMAPFRRLGRLEREKDRIYMMLCNIARRME
jgi:hypothetical protein